MTAEQKCWRIRSYFATPNGTVFEAKLSTIRRGKSQPKNAFGVWRSAFGRRASVEGARLERIYGAYGAYEVERRRASTTNAERQTLSFHLEEPPKSVKNIPF
jgi:hypothetical protein